MFRCFEATIFHLLTYPDLPLSVLCLLSTFSCTYLRLEFKQSPGSKIFYFISTEISCSAIFTEF